MKNITTFKQLLAKHDYYSSDSNYFSNEYPAKFDCFKSFYDEYIKADVDMNLIFRWDILKNEEGEGEGHYMMIFIIHQRKGIYAPNLIKSVTEADFEMIKEILTIHHNKLKQIWKPF